MINEKRVYFSKRARAAVDATTKYGTLSDLKRLVGAAKRIDFVEAVAMVDEELDDRNFYMLTRSGMAILGMRANLKEDGHTLETFTLVVRR